MGFLQNARISFYENSHLLKYSEEAIAKTVGTLNPIRGLAFPLSATESISFAWCSKVDYMLEASTARTGWGRIFEANGIRLSSGLICASVKKIQNILLVRLTLLPFLGELCPGCIMSCE